MIIASRPHLFAIVAGRDLLEKMEAEQKALVPLTGNGYASEELCELQRKQASRGLVGVEIVSSLYGHSVRYDSGLQNFGLVASSKSKQLDGSLEDAERFARDWVATDPDRRYAWRRVA